MTRQLELKNEEMTSRRNAALVRALDFELIGVLSSCGIELMGFSVKLGQDDCLITLRAFVEDIRQVSFVTADTFPAGILKTIARARTDRLKWRVDKY